MPTRTEIVTDWQSRLAAAEAAVADASQLTWLHRARARLYRFLLSLYADGNWNADACESRETALVESSQSAAVTDSPEALPWAGKPAKSVGKIQAVLKAVANANEAPPAGPMAAGFTSEHWVIAAAESDGYRLHECGTVLHRSHIAHRIEYRGADRILLTRADDLPQAVQLVSAIRGSRRPPPPPRALDLTAPSFECAPAMVVLLTGMFVVGPVVACLLAGLIWIEAGGRSTGDAQPLIVAVFLASWAATAGVAFALFIWLFINAVARALRRTRRMRQHSAGPG